MQGGRAGVQRRPASWRRIERDLAAGFIKQSNAHAGRDPRSFAHREHVRVFTIGNAVKRHANALADGGAALLQVDIEGDGVSVFPGRMKPIAADLSHIDRHLAVARFNAARLGNNYPLKAHVSAGQHNVPLVTGQRQWREQEYQQT